LPNFNGQKIFENLTAIKNLKAKIAFWKNSKKINNEHFQYIENQSNDHFEALVIIYANSCYVVKLLLLTADVPSKVFT